jgi:hypothetical protein
VLRGKFIKRFSYWGRDFAGQLCQGEKPQLLHLARLRNRRAVPVAANIDDIDIENLLAVRVYIPQLGTGKHAVQLERVRDKSRFLAQLARRRFLQHLAGLNGATVVAPHAVVGAALEQYSAVTIEQYHARADLKYRSVPDKPAQRFDVFSHFKNLCFTQEILTARILYIPLGFDALHSAERDI